MTYSRIRKINFLLFKFQFLFLIILFILFFIISYNFLETTTLVVRNKYNIMLKNNQLHSSVRPLNNVSTKDEKNLKYILEWGFRWISMSETEGQSIFIKANCEYTNCFATSRRDYLRHYTNFDVIVFGEFVSTFSNRDLPKLRSPHQKYVFASLESSVYYPVCSSRFDGYFNWTWTFRLDSDISLGYIVIRDINGTIIGPKPEMHWMKLVDMDPVSKDLRNKLKNKTKFATWVVSNCNAVNDRENFVSNLSKELKLYGDDYQVEVYGRCGGHGCPPSEDFYKNYYFYLAFENSFNPDYVTEKLIRAIVFYTIPVVYGGANYTRFMPDGIYLNAIELGVQKLAAKMVDIVKDFERFVEFFKWRNHYTYSSRNTQPDSDDYCTFCALLNNESEMTKVTVKKNFREWWDSPNAQC